MEDLGAVIAQLESSRAGHWMDPVETSQTLQGAISALKSIIRDLACGLQIAGEREILLRQAQSLALRVKAGERLHQQSILLRQARYKELAERAGLVCGSEYGPGSAAASQFETHRLVAEG